MSVAGSSGGVLGGTAGEGRSLWAGARLRQRQQIVELVAFHPLHLEQVQPADMAALRVDSAEL